MVVIKKQTCSFEALFEMEKAVLNLIIFKFFYIYVYFVCVVEVFVIFHCNSRRKEGWHWLMVTVSFSKEYLAIHKEEVMVCDRCEKKLSTIITPDTWKDGSRNAKTGKMGRKVNVNMLGSKYGKINVRVA